MKKRLKLGIRPIFCPRATVTSQTIDVCMMGNYKRTCYISSSVTSLRRKQGDIVFFSVTEIKCSHVSHAKLIMEKDRALQGEKKNKINTAAGKFLTHAQEGGFMVGVEWMWPFVHAWQPWRINDNVREERWMNMFVFLHGHSADNLSSRPVFLSWRTFESTLVKECSGNKVKGEQRGEYTGCWLMTSLKPTSNTQHHSNTPHICCKIKKKWQECDQEMCDSVRRR